MLYLLLRRCIDLALSTWCAPDWPITGVAGLHLELSARSPWLP